MLLQLVLPVPADRAGDVAGVVGGGIDVDLDQSHVRVVAVLVRPCGADEDIGVRGAFTHCH
jgi:hypothetical protein